MMYIVGLIFAGCVFVYSFYQFQKGNKMYGTFCYICLCLAIYALFMLLLPVIEKTFSNTAIPIILAGIVLLTASRYFLSK